MTIQSQVTCAARAKTAGSLAPDDDLHAPRRQSFASALPCLRVFVNGYAEDRDASPYLPWKACRMVCGVSAADFGNQHQRPLLPWRTTFPATMARKVQLRFCRCR